MVKTEKVEVEHKFVVRGSKKSGQKSIGVPDKCNLDFGDEVIVTKVIK